MKNRRAWTVGATVVLLIAVAAPLAAIEVPLAYKTETGDSRAWFPAGSTGVNRTVRPPPGAWKLPELKARYPLYATVRLGNQKQLLVLDRRSDKSAFYDTLYFDANGNRDLTDDAILAGEIRRNTDTYVETWFKPVDVEVMAGGARTPFRFIPRAFTGDLKSFNDANAPLDVVLRNVSLSLSTACSYSGSFPFEGRTYTIALGDSNCDGVFDTRLVPSQNSGPDDRMYLIGDWLCLAEGQPDARSMFVLSGYLALGKSLFSVDVDIPRKTVTLTPVEQGVTVRLPKPAVKLQLLCTDAASSVMAFACTDSIKVPEGAYKVCSYLLREKDSYGGVWEAEAAGTDSAEFVALSATGTREVSFGPPYAPRVFLYDWDYITFVSGRQKQVGLYFAVYGKGGEILTNLYRVSGTGTQLPMSSSNTSRPKEPSYIVLKSSGETVAKGDFQYG